MTTPPLTPEIATLGGGCFWCLEAVFSCLAGVQQVVTGYAGGQMKNPDYRTVCSGETGHIEVVQLTFDPRIIDYRTLLEIFFTLHDPTSIDRQGNDIGTQYRSVIFAHDAGQEAIARAVITELDTAKIWPMPIVTAVLPAPTFWPAEAFHQGYFARNPDEAYCRLVVSPKVAKLRRLFADRLAS